MSNSDKFVRIIKEKYTSLEDIEEIILELKLNGASQFETTKLLVNTLNISLKVADEFVLNSKAWNELKNTNEFLRKKFLE